ncbi:MAG: metallophosphoesterase [Bacillales bacterium]|nr:metallophosphoesterase [Bacillales bacterium]
MKEKKKKRGLGWKIPLYILGGLMLFFVLIGFVNHCLNWSLRAYIKSFSAVEYDSDRLVPTLDENGYYVFTTDDDLKVLQITDVHLGGGFLSYNKDKEAINCVMTMIQTEKPDLVIYTGDNVFAVPQTSGTINNRMVSKTFILMNEQLGCYYTTTFGNHDSEVFDYYNREALAELYSKDKWTHCLYKESVTDITGESNQVILVKRTDGLISKALFMLDSNSYINGSINAVLNWQYDIIHQDQVNWMKNTIISLSSYNNQILSTMTDTEKPDDLDNFTTVKSLLFIHIPTGEFKTAYEELKANDFLDTADSHYIGGVMDEKDEPYIWYGGYNVLAENPVSPNQEDDLFETIKTTGSLEAIFCGHDHLNNFQIDYQGVLLSYGYSVDYLAYSGIDQYGLQRGLTVINISSSGDFTETHENYYQDKYVSEKGKEEVNLTDYYNEAVYPSLD